MRNGSGPISRPFLFLCFGTLLAASVAFSVERDPKIYVSTLGMSVRTDPRTPRLPGTPTLYKIQSREDGQQLVGFFLTALEEKTWKQDEVLWGMLHRSLTKRDYAKETAYVLYIPSDEKGLDAEQPWHLKGSNDLIFELKVDPKSIGRFYFRVYIVGKDRDKYDKFTLYQGQRSKLAPLITDRSGK